MGEEREKRRSRRATGEPAQAAAAQANLKAGEILRQARIAKGLELEEISSAIHVRVGQLKAIEENHLDALPGMTYALGFVKSYATYLKIDAIEVANKFKAENGAAEPKRVLQNHEPIAASKMPDPFVLGVAGVFFLIVFAVWAIFSGGDDNAKEIASNIPPAPAIADVPAVAVPAAAPEVTTAADSGSTPIATGPLGTPVTPVQNIAGVTPPAANNTAASDTVTSALPHPKPAAGADVTEATTVTATAAEPAAAQPAIAADAAQPASPAEEPINIKSGRGRVALRATQQSWVQITNGGNVVFKKVLQPGETYYVPSGANYSMVTSNAGGIDVYIDGSKVKTLGGQGDIVRGVRLQPETLMRNRPRKSAFQE